MHSEDTADAAHLAQLRVYASMTGEKRVEIAMALSETVREIAREGIRTRHPEYTARQLELALLRMLYGEELIRRAFPSEPPPPPTSSESTAKRSTPHIWSVGLTRSMYVRSGIEYAVRKDPSCGS